MRLRWRLFLLVVGLIAAGAVLYLPLRSTGAQESVSCPMLVRQAYQLLNGACLGLDRNEACVAGSPAGGLDENGEMWFSPGEEFEVNPFLSLLTRPMSVEGGEWGALAISQGAGLPANTPEHVTMWLFGGAELIDRRSEEQRNAPPTATCYATVVTDSLNIRAFPANNSLILGAFQRGDTLIITGRLADATWWRIDHNNQPAWVFSGFVQTVCQIVEIPVVLRDAPALPESGWYRDPFQTAALRTEPVEETCSNAPPSGMLLQPPTSGRARMTLNGVNFDLDSSMYVQANDEEQLLFQAIEGSFSLSLPDGWTQEVPPGAQVRFPLSPDGMTAIGRPTGLEPLDVEALAGLPINRLPHPITRLPLPVVELPTGTRQELSGNLVAGDPLTFFFDRRGGIVHEIELISDGYPVLSIYDPDLPVLRPYIPLGHLQMSYWTVSDESHLFTLEAGTSLSGEYQMWVSTKDLQLCRAEGNSQSATLPGGEDHAGNLWFGREGEVVTLTATGNVSHTAESYPGWRLRIFDTFLETPTLPPIQVDLLEGHNADSVTWTVPRTGYYWIEVWTESRGTTTVTSECAE